jgi:hypothetical protein
MLNSFKSYSCNTIGNAKSVHVPAVVLGNAESVHVTAVVFVFVRYKNLVPRASK